MIQISAGKYDIQIISEEAYRIFSMDNVNQYGVIHGASNKGETNPTAKYGVSIWLDEKRVASALLVSEDCVPTTPHPKSAVVDGDRLTVIVGDCVFCLLVPMLALVWQTRCRDTVTCFELYKIAGGFIVHGEMSILRISNEGLILWEQFGRDIFTTPEGTNDFILHDDYLVVKDWDHNIYHINFDGTTKG